MSARIALAGLAVIILTAETAQSQNPRERVDAAMERAGRAGVPAALLQDKVDEGLAKGVPFDRIAIVVEQRADALMSARELLSRGGREPAASDLTAAADALGRGISQAVLLALDEASPRERRAVAITSLTELVALGIAPDEALQRVTSALARGADALTALPGHASDARGRQGPVSEAAGATGAGRPQVGTPAGVPSAGRPIEAGRPSPGERPGPGSPGAEPR